MIKTDVTVPIGYRTEDIKKAISERLPVSDEEIGEIRILKQSLLLSSEKAAAYKLSVGVAFSAEREAGLLKMKKKVSQLSDFSLNIPPSRLRSRPVIVGSGPAGLFCALLLSEAGARPIILERGLNVEQRIKKVKEFERLGILDTECNIQFGEGGAGTYSDGKLKVGSMDKYKMYILSAFREAGAEQDIMYSSSAHLGTDKLSGIIKNLREKMISLGAEFVFGARLVGIRAENGRVKEAEYEKNGERRAIPASTLILATGHSAHDTFQLLMKMNLPMQAKGFGVGVRVEHPREYVNELVYGKNYNVGLGSASYHLVTHLPSGRSVYSFCMCPGGSVVSATSCEGRVVTNGMSELSRMGENSNAAILVSVFPSDFSSDSPLAGLEYQKNIERLAFSAAGGDYKAPAMRLSDLYSSGKPSLGEAVNPTYPRGVVAAGCDKYLPSYAVNSLRAGFVDFDKWIPGYFMGDAILTGAETRSTSPVRILRSDSFEAIGLSGLFPIGEGAGYAGGIISSAADGVRCAESILYREGR